MQGIINFFEVWPKIQGILKKSGKSGKFTKFIKYNVFANVNIMSTFTMC